MAGFGSSGRRGATAGRSYTRTSKSNVSGGSYGGTSRRSTRGKAGATASIAPGYSQIKNQFDWKLQSFRTLCDQTKGAAKGNRPSPATLKSFANWINKGANVWKVSNAQLSKWCGVTKPLRSGTSAKTALCQKFGKSTIKAVAPAKSGGFIVATAPTWKGGKAFKFPS